MVRGAHGAPAGPGRPRGVALTFPTVTQVARRDQIDDLRARLRDAPRVALDTEFHAERRYLPKLYLVQLHLDDGTTWLIDPLNEGVLESLAEVLTAVPWVVHGGQQDIRLLLDVAGAVPQRVLDTQIAAGLVTDGFPTSFGELVQTWRDVRLPKLATLSDWSRRPLSRAQLKYAAADALHLLPLWDALATEASALERLPLVHGACEEARDRVVDPPPSDTLWRALPAARVLTPQEAAVLQELIAWREETARALDQPPRYLLNDGIAVDIARRQPLTLDSLAANRRMSRGLVKAWGDALLERIARAAARPEWAWPCPVAERSREGRRAGWLVLWALARGHAAKWAQPLVLPLTLAEDLAADPPPSRPVLAETLGGWRDDLIGDALWSALQGHEALTFHDDVTPITRP